MIHSPSPCPLLSISQSLVMTMTPEMQQTHAHVSLATRSIASPPIMTGLEVLRLSSFLGIVYLLACTKTDIVPRHSPSNSHAIEESLTKRLRRRDTAIPARLLCWC
ncbi:hypothetical protein Naga_101544g1 [Nannochloropsis gaditana]|uniref:Uncharacterized protein n=1 Tax=Nannochloropsis gaditana TaxID=72520 RepID=W7T648_9STRA|nr:hypothetical protein Naga_101544g1 [Nannochloropsis gaditana]